MATNVLFCLVLVSSSLLLDDVLSMPNNSVTNGSNNQELNKTNLLPESNNSVSCLSMLPRSCFRGGNRKRKRNSAIATPNLNGNQATKCENGSDTPEKHTNENAKDDHTKTECEIGSGNLENDTNANIEPANTEKLERSPSTIAEEERKDKEFILNLNLYENIKETTVDQIRNDILKQTNYYRGIHKLSPLELDDELNNYAQIWASQLKTLKYNPVSRELKLGETMYRDITKGVQHTIGKEAVDEWYARLRFCRSDYSEDGLKNNLEIAFALQLLWKPATKLGCGVSKPEASLWFVVCNYDSSPLDSDDYTSNLPKITGSHFGSVKK